MARGGGSVDSSEMLTESLLAYNVFTCIVLIVGCGALMETCGV